MRDDDGFSDEVLRSAYRTLVDEAEDRGGPDAGRVWDAALGSSPVDERRRVVDEIAREPGAALSWRLARELQADLEKAAEVTPLPRRTAARRIVHHATWAAAAALVLSIGSWALRPGPTSAPEAPIYRDPEQGRDPDRMRAETSEPALERGQFLLRWSRAAEGARYDVQVMTESLVEIASARDLDRPELVVVSPALRAIAPGTRILWQVTARLRSGAEVRSETFVSVIQ